MFSKSFNKIKRILKDLYPGKTLSEGIKKFFEEDLIPNFQEVLIYAQTEAERAKKFIKKHNLATIPQEKLKIIETPPHILPILPSAGYEDAPYFKKEQPGIFMISPTQKEFQSYTSISNWMVHEAYPGHHLDFASNNAFAPLIRILGPSTETVEGWAIYCEEMMLQEGFLASNAFYAMYAHQIEHVEQYLCAVDKVFRRIADVKVSGKLENMLKGQAAVAGFERLM